MPNPLTVLRDNTAAVRKALTDLSRTRVMVGVPSDAERAAAGNPGGGSEHRTTVAGEVIGNATLAYINENGSPINNIPARPFLGPGVEGSKAQWLSYLEQAGKAALAGKPEVVDRALNAAGLTAVSAVKAKITAGLEPPLKQSTVEGRRRRNPSRKALTPADVKPLIDTGQLLNSLSYVVRKKK